MTGSLNVASLLQLRSSTTDLVVVVVVVDDLTTGPQRRARLLALGGDLSPRRSSLNNTSTNLIHRRFQQPAPSTVDVVSNDDNDHSLLSTTPLLHLDRAAVAATIIVTTEPQRRLFPSRHEVPSTVPNFTFNQSCRSSRRERNPTIQHFGTFCANFALVSVYFIHHNTFLFYDFCVWDVAKSLKCLYGENGPDIWSYLSRQDISVWAHRYVQPGWCAHIRKMEHRWYHVCLVGWTAIEQLWLRHPEI
ncbi:hypothetical protein BKA70DRAFT_1407911 [Coprinopsis sp. MPI-PUGE-AT-0042]|nr:hypothetical protein BKA70DRAFT_1407911 [Coprinopsis sp. MPI-PUGE-AT-0042]